MKWSFNILAHTTNYFMGNILFLIERTLLLHWYHKIQRIILFGYEVIQRLPS